MLIGERLRALRESKNLSQGDIEERCGLLRSYLSRVENGHTVPAVDTLEKWAHALEIPLYQLFYEGEKLPKFSNPPKHLTPPRIARDRSKKEAIFLEKLRQLLARMDDVDRQLLLYTAQRMARR